MSKKNKNKQQHKSVKKEQNLRIIKLKNFYKKNLALFLILLVIIIIGSFAIYVGSGDNSKENLVYGDDVIELYYFHLSTCPHCHDQNRFMENVLFEQYPNVKLIEYEMTKAGSMEKYIEMAQNYNQLNPQQFPGTPLTIIGKEVNVGYGTDETTGQRIIEMVEIEQKKIDANWDDTKIRTIDLRTQNE